MVGQERVDARERQQPRSSRAQTADALVARDRRGDRCELGKDYRVIDSRLIEHFQIVRGIASRAHEVVERAAQLAVHELDELRRPLDGVVVGMNVKIDYRHRCYAPSFAPAGQTLRTVGRIFSSTKMFSPPPCGGIARCATPRGISSISPALISSVPSSVSQIIPP